VTSFFPGVRPAELIPGDPGELRWLAGRLRVLGDGMGEAAGELGLIDGEGWEGPAAEAFRTAAKLPPIRYRDAAVGFSAASSAVLGYANALEAAQQDASRAITAHQEADNATAAWRQHQQADAQALAERAATHPGQSPAPPSTPGTDPGDPGRSQAEAALLDARLALDAAAARLRATLTDAQLAAPTKSGQSNAHFSQADLGRLGNSAQDAGYGFDVAVGLFAAWRPLKVVGYAPGASTWIKVGSGSKWVLGHREALPWQARWATRMKVGGVGLAGAAGFLQQFDKDSGRYPLGAKLARATTAGAVSAGAAVAVGAGAEAFVAVPTVAVLIPEFGAVIAIPGFGEVAAVVVLAIAVGWVVNKYVLPTVDEELFTAEHWATHQGAHAVAGFAREEARGYVDEGRAVASLATGGAHLAGAGIHDVSSVAVSVGDTAGHAGTTVVHGFGKAKDEVVKHWKSGFGLLG
jgi:hypothetical protein